MLLYSTAPACSSFCSDVCPFVVTLCSTTVATVLNTGLVVAVKIGYSLLVLVLPSHRCLKLYVIRKIELE